MFESLRNIESKFTQTKSKAKAILKRTGFHFLVICVTSVFFDNPVGNAVLAYAGIICLYHKNFRIKDNLTLFPTVTAAAQLCICLFGSLVSFPAAIFWAGVQSWTQRAVLRKFKIGFEWVVTVLFAAAINDQLENASKDIIPMGLFIVTFICGICSFKLAEKKDRQLASKPPAAKTAPLSQKQRPYAAFYEKTALLEKKSESLPAYLSEHTLSISRSTRNILKCMQTDPEDVVPGSRFLDRYLPAVHKMVDEYTRLENEGSGHSEIDTVLGKTEELLERMAQAFHREHGNLLRNDAMALNAELGMLDKLLKMDGK